MNIGSNKEPAVSIMNSLKRMLYGTTDKDIETVDGYLTADSWYRPKVHLKRWKTWTAEGAMKNVGKH